MFERACVATVSACQGWRGVRATRRAQRRQEEDPHLSPFTLTLTRRAQWRQEEFRRGLQRADAGAVRLVGRLRGASARRDRCRAANWLGGRPHARALITTPSIHTIAMPMC
eukprot:scaffold25184_cov62-Phaeocystis_antarctica.AAC.5